MIALPLRHRHQRLRLLELRQGGAPDAQRRAGDPRERARALRDGRPRWPPTPACRCRKVYLIRERPAERLRHRAQPRERRGGGDDRHPAAPRPRRARRRDRPRARPHQEPRHPDDDRRRDRRRRHLDAGPVRLLLRRRARPRQPARAARRAARGDLRADGGDADPDDDQPDARIFRRPRRRARSAASRWRWPARCARSRPMPSEIPMPSAERNPASAPLFIINPLQRRSGWTTSSPPIRTSRTASARSRRSPAEMPAPAGVAASRQTSIPRAGRTVR